MITLPRKFFFALEAVLYIACQTGVHPVSSKKICAQNGLTPRYLEPIMQQLVHAGILRGVRGPKGGYFLARERRKITAAEIFLLIRQFEQESDKQRTAKDFADSILGSSIILPLWEKSETHIISQLQEISIEDLCRQAEEKGILESIRNAADFVI